MAWLAWRQFRANALFATAAIGAVVTVLVVTHSRVATAADPGDLASGYQSLRLLGTVLIGTPAFIGAFWGAPLIARELETGTHRLVWTQSVTRRRWLTTKLGVAGVATVVITGVFSLVFTWWSLPFDEFGNRVGTANFGQRGVAPVAYGLFALSLGALAGAVLRRTLPAMAVTLVGFFVLRFGYQLFVRPTLLLNPVTTTLPTNLFGQRQGQAASAGGWILSSQTVDRAGHAMSEAQIDQVLAEACGLTRDSTPGQWANCSTRLGFRDVVRMHPADHFWPLQTWETLSFVVLAGVLALITYRWIRHRAA
jgi:ABC-type transport system involved in multi-copper enzyme maturation permease subunit